MGHFSRRFQAWAPGSLWAALPPAAANTGKTYRLLDSWAAGLTATSTGSYWKLSGKVRLSAGAPNDTVTGTTSRALLREIVIPGKLMGPLGILRADALLSFTINANAKNPQAYMYQTAGGLAGGTLIATTGMSNQGAQGQCVLVRNTAHNAQVAITANTIGSLGPSGVAHVTPAIDTDQDWIFAYACTPANAGDTTRLLHYAIEIDQRLP